MKPVYFILLFSISAIYSVPPEKQHKLINNTGHAIIFRLRNGDVAHNDVQQGDIIAENQRMVPAEIYCLPEPLTTNMIYTTSKLALRIMHGGVTTAGATLTPSIGGFYIKNRELKEQFELSIHYDEEGYLTYSTF